MHFSDRLSEGCVVGPSALKQRGQVPRLVPIFVLRLGDIWGKEPVMNRVVFLEGKNNIQIYLKIQTRCHIGQLWTVPDLQADILSD